MRYGAYIVLLLIRQPALLLLIRVKRVGASQREKRVPIKAVLPEP